ncbi:MAG: hypothetical protein OEZ01_16120 [Candidatus Heimdallarchaeota archaeon]|nr:hypothetical protein [Candidatus Heimdallarchaeota archaeon]MDH5647537.1 hypothetical protein [Candidatus Heimdallarchaeota archaeon]
MAVDLNQKFFSASEEEINAIKSRLYLTEGDILIWKQLPYTTDYTLEIFIDHLDQLIKNLSQVYVIVDLSEVIQRMTVIQREKIQQKIVQYGIARLIVFVTGKSLIFTTIIRFMMGGIKFRSYFVYKDMNSALGKIREEKDKHLID